MARRRYLQPPFWTNPLLSRCPALTRLMFQGIWTHADFDGCFQWDPDDLAMKILPRDDFDAAEALDRLERDGFIRSYIVKGKRFGYVVTWHKHQDPHPGEKPIYPKPAGDPEFIVKVKEYRWRKAGDTAFDHPEIERGLYPWVQLASNLQVDCGEVAERLSATDKERKESPDQKGISTNVLGVPRAGVEVTATPPTVKATAPKPKPSVDDSLESILGGKDSPAWTSYWKLAGLFGPGKNPAPKTTAKLYAYAIVGFHPDHLLEKAQELVKATSEQKYLPQLAKWLEGEGYRNPTPSRQPAKSSSVSADDATREQIRAMPLRMLNEVAG